MDSTDTIENGVVVRSLMVAINLWALKVER